MDTIFAVSSGPAPAAIAVLRVSGAGAAEVAAMVASGVPAPRRAVLRRLRDATGATLDRALVLWFPGPATATGEDLLELHLHGGRAVIAAVERAIAAVPGTRRAEPGEFTRRALMAGRIDLAQATGLADLLAAETEGDRRAAIALTDGAFSRDVRRWLDALSGVRALIEAAIDYDDEDDVRVDGALIEVPLRGLITDLGARLAAPSVERAREGLRVVLAGPPNAGKSSLLNALAGRDAAIVAPVAGTTRDRIEVTVHRAERTYTIVDTAGLAETTDDAIEAAGIARALEAAAAADLILWLGDTPPPDAARSLWLRSRCDVEGRASAEQGEALAVSALRPESVDALWDMIAVRAEAIIPAPEQYLIHARQQDAVREAASLCVAAISERDPVLLAEGLRQAARILARLLGIDETEAMLDALFSRFCVGK